MMSLDEWTPELSVGDERIDAQHRELFRRAARLFEGLRRGEPEEIGELVGFLREYVVEHFATEEALMRETRYPGYASHKAEHDEFISDLLELSAEHERDGSGAFMTVKASHWLKEWLRQHVSGTDAELGRFLAGRRR